MQLAVSAKEEKEKPHLASRAGFSLQTCWKWNSEWMDIFLDNNCTTFRAIKRRGFLFEMYTSADNTGSGLRA